MTEISHSRGFSIARTFHDEWVKPYLESEFGDLANRVASVLVGNSQSLGNDDDLSKDHGWGPTLKLLLRGSDMPQGGQRLRHALKKDVPRQWDGEEFKDDPEDRVEVVSINVWFRREIGVTHRPKARAGWRRTRQTHLYMLRHSTIVHDPLGDFTERRASFHSYPRDVWLGEVRAQLLMVWHHGQYNFIRRMAQRDDFVTTEICLSQFVQATMKLCMLLNGDFAPYWKWLPTEFRKQPNVASLDGKLERLLRVSDTTERINLVDEVSKDIFRRFADKDLDFDVPIDDTNSLAKIHDVLENQGY